MHLLAFALMGCDEVPARAHAELKAASRSNCVAALPARVQRGICYAHNYQRGGANGYGSEASASSRKELARAGVKWLSITPFGFSRTLHEPAVHAIGDYPAGETDARVRAEIRAARTDGFSVLLKPHIWIGTGEWVGHLAFSTDAERKAWHESYEAWILAYARLAAEEHVEILSIATELGSMTPDELRRRALIAKIRASYPGKLTLGANWNEVERVPFWDALDFVGVQFYAPLEDTQTAASEESRNRKLRQHLDVYDAVAKRAGKPLLFTEVGYRSTPDTNAAPHLWPEQHRRSADQATQAAAYQRFFQAISTRESVAGVYIWKWFTDPASLEEGGDGFSPRGKRSERVLRSAYSGECDQIAKP